MTGRSQKGRPGYFLYPALTALIVVAIVPLGYAAYIAVHEINLTMPYLGTPFVGLKNFERVLTDQRSLEAVERTLAFLLLTILPETLIGLFLSWAIHKGCTLGERVWITVLLVLPMAIPKVVGGLIWKVLYDPLVGPINFVLEMLHLPDVAWLADPRLALGSVAVVDIWQWTPFMILILLAGLESQQKELFEAASLDGATDFEMFWSIALPLLRPFITVLFRSLDAMRTFDYLFTLTQGGPARATETVDLFAYAVGISESGDISTATAAAFALLVITIALGSAWSRLMKWGQPT